MYTLKRIKRNIQNDLYDHPIRKEALRFFYVSFMVVLSAFIFTLGFNTFTNPNFSAIAAGGMDVSGIKIHQLASVGASGLSQALITMLKILNFTWISTENNANIMYWIFYFSVNVPLFILAYTKIGKRFAWFTLLHVLMCSVFGVVLKSNDPQFFVNQLSSVFITSPLSRVLFAGLFTGVSSGLAYIVETSAGGSDVVTYYISEKKRILTGKYHLIINMVVVSIFSILSMVPVNEVFGSAVPLYTVLAVFLYTFCYMVVVSFTIDKIDKNNLKVQVQIITTEKTLPNNIIAAIPHSCTIMNGYGGYSLEPKYVLLMSVRYKEVNKILDICRREDSHAFVNIYRLDNVYGKFFRKPIK